MPGEHLSFINAQRSIGAFQSYGGDQEHPRLKMLKNIGSNWVLMIVTAAVSYILLPFNLHKLGASQYGIWLLVTSTTNYMSLLVIGIPMASVRYTAKHAAEKNYEQLNEMVANCAALYIFLGLLSFVVGAGLFLGFERIYAIPAGMLWPVRLAFACVVLNVAVGFFSQLPYGVMEAHQDFVALNIVLCVGAFIKLVTTIALVELRPSLLCLAIAQIVTSLGTLAIIWVVLRRRHPHVELRLGRVKMSVIRTVFSFSVFVLILSVGYQLSFNTDSLVIGRFLPLGDISVYAVANGLLVYLIQLITGVGAVVMPMTTKLQAEGNADELRKLFLKWSKISLSLSVLATAYLLVLGPKVVEVWVGSKFDPRAGTVLQVLVISSLLFLPARGVALPMLLGLGKARRATVAFLASGVLNLVMSIALVKPWGLAGVAWGTTIPNAAFSVAILWLTCVEFGVPVREYLKYVTTRVVIGAVPLLALLLWLNRITAPTYLSVGMAGVVACGVSALVWAVFVYRSDPYVDLQSRLAPAFRRRLGIA
jgi:O-antigen/teichoic acid export membrane protein